MSKNLTERQEQILGFIDEFIKKMMQGRRWGKVDFYKEAAKKQKEYSDGA